MYKLKFKYIYLHNIKECYLQKAKIKALENDYIHLTFRMTTEHRKHKGKERMCRKSCAK